MADPLELIEKKRAELEQTKAQYIRNIDAVDGALQVLDELEKALKDENQISD
jgi:hypothetical protein